MGDGINDANSSRRAESDLLESLADGFYEVDADGRFTAVNGALCRLLGREREEIVGRPYARLLARAPEQDPFRDPSSVARFVWHVGPTEAMRVLEGSVAPVRGERGTLAGFQGMVRDVTERDRIAAELERARADAVAHVVAKSEFVAHVSHDLRTPMNGIIGMTELALDTDLTDEQREYLTTVRTSAQSLLTLVNDILDFSKMDADRLELERIPFSLRDCVAETLRPLSIAAHAKQLELLFEIDPAVPDSIVGDPTRLRQVLVNLADNAIKFTRRGQVVVRVEVEGLDGTETVLRFRVSDTGIGIPTDETESIFNAFAQAGSADDRRRGTGLGLAISRKLVRLMGGRIGVASDPGRGSVFCFTAHFSIGPGSTRHMLACHEDLKGLRVLLADGNAVSRQILDDGLRYFGLRVDAVASSEAALRTILEAQRGGRAYRVAAIDMQLPDADGFTVAARICAAAEPERPRVILLTRSGQRGDAARCRHIGVAGYLSKPVGPLDLLDAIRAVIGRTDDAPWPALVTRHSLRESRPQLDILVAEDDPVSQLVIRTLLEKSGHNATVVAAGDQVIEAVSRQPFDVVLMDVNMPGMDGVATTRILRQREEARPGGARLPIVALTALAFDGEEKRLLAAGMDAYLAKPFEPGDLFALLERVAPNGRDRGRAPIPCAPGAAVDREKLLEQTGGDTDLVRQVVEVFLEEKAGMIGAIRAAVERGDAAEIARTAHRVKGTCVTLAARLAAEAAAQLERMGLAGDLGHVRPLCDLLDDRVRQVEDELVILVRPWGPRRPAST